MGDITTIGLDLAKNVFQVHAVDEAGNVVVRIDNHRCTMTGLLNKRPGSDVSLAGTSRRLIG